MKIVAWLILLAISRCLSASTIPQYQISSIDLQTKVMTFSNDATLEISLKGIPTLEEWQVGDSVEILSAVIRSIADRVTIVDDELVFYPMFFLLNSTNNNGQINAWLTEPPTLPHAGTFSVLAINFDNQSITLSDATVWTYCSSDDFLVRGWEIGDIVMIGVNTMLFYQEFDAVLFNTRQQSMIRVVE